MAPKIGLSGGCLQIGGIPILDLAGRFGSPLYVYDAEAIRDRVAQLKTGIAYSPLEIFYSVKANASVGLLRFLRTLGVRADVCSEGDLLFAQSAGFRTDEISFAGFGLGEAEYEMIAADPAMVVVLDSLSQIRRVGEHSPGRHVALRVRPGIEAGFHPDVQAGAAGSKFGLDRSELTDALRLASSASLRVVGIHAHMGSDILETRPYTELLRTLLELSGGFPDLEFVNLGGGFGTPYLDGDQELDIAELGAQFGAMFAQENAKRGRSLTLRIEPGAYLLMDAGFLISTVTEVKPAPPGREVDATICVDSSSNHMVSAVIYRAEHPVWVDSPKPRESGRFDVVGNLMQAGDVLARERVMPEASVGDLLAFGKCGAYTSCRSTTFNNRPRPPEVLVDGENVSLLRRGETPRDLLRLDEF